MEVNARNSLQDKFVNLLPRTPYCTDDYSGGIRHQTKDKAIQYSYIQFNNINSAAIINIDLDYDTYPHDIQPLPNLVMYNKSNCRAHAMYFLEKPVHLNESSSTKAKMYLIAVHNALIRHLKGDEHYSHLMAKNPMSSIWRCFAMNDNFWSLEHLCEYFNLSSKPTKNVLTIPLAAFGRNCFIFETARRWAYKAIRAFKNASLEIFLSHVYAHCYELNANLEDPLHPMELRHIAKSIAKWVWAERVNLTNFSKQAYLGQLSGNARLLKAQANKQKVLELLNNGKTVTDIAERLQIHRTTVWRLINLTE